MGGSAEGMDVSPRCTSSEIRSKNRGAAPCFHCASTYSVPNIQPGD